jgi:hypothetical protein
MVVLECPEVELYCLTTCLLNIPHCSIFAHDRTVQPQSRPCHDEQIALDLDELLLPYLFDVQAVERISHLPLLEHIQRVGVPLYP